MTNIKETILDYINNKDMDSLKQLINKAEDVEILYVIKELSPDEQVIVYRLLTKDRALFVFEQLGTNVQQKLLNSFTEDKAIETITELDPDDRVRLLDELPATVAKKLISALSTEEREITNILLGYEAETAGRIMTTEYICLKRDLTVDEALKRVKENAKEKETIYTLYVTDNSRKLEGVLSLKDLFIADSNSKIEDIMLKKVVKVSTDTDQEKVAKVLQEFDLLAIPVVDKEDRLVGIVTIDDAMDILEEEATEDIFDKAGLSDLTKKESNRSDVLINGSMWEIWKVRLPFLVITLFGGLLAGFVIEGFEETIQSIAVVAVFMPIIMDMGGNVGTQSSTVFARGLLLGQIRMKDIRKHLLKEMSVGLSIGAIVGISTGIVATLWQGIPELGLAVGLSLIITMTFATALGFIVPYVLIKLNIDQAAGTDPIITSIKDVTGLLVYFLLVDLFLGGLIY